MRLLLKNAVILTQNDRGDILERGDMLVEDGVISEIAGKIEAVADKVIDCEGKLIMPGLANSHLHSDENMFKGLFDNLPLEPWMLYSCPPLAYGPFRERLIYLRTAIGAIEMIKQGITAVQDDVSECPAATFEGYDQVYQAYRDSGLKANVAMNMGNREYCDKLPFAREVIPFALQKQLDGHPDPEEMLELYRAVIQKWNGRDGVKVVLSSSAPQRCTDDYLIRLLKLGEELDLPMHTHILETRMQRVTGTEFYGKSIVQHIEDIGFLTDRLTIIHGVWMDDEDFEVIAKRGATLAHNPVSNLKLGSGILPLIRAVGHGVNVVLGTDGMSSNDGQSIFEAMKFAALLQKVSNPDYRTWLDSREILKMATVNAAYSMRRTHETGCLEAGKDADFLIVNLKGTAFTPCNDLYNHLVYCEKGDSVEASFVKGKKIFGNGKVEGFDEAAVVHELHELQGEFKEAFAETVKKNDRLMPYINHIYGKSVELLNRDGQNLFS